MNHLQITNLHAIIDRIKTILSKLRTYCAANGKCLHEETAEKNLTALTKELSDLFEAKEMQEKIIDESFQLRIKQLMSGIKKKTLMKDYRRYTVMFRNGTKIDLYHPYYVIKKGGKQKERGFYPAMALLGIYHHCSAELCSYVSQLSSSLCSYDEAIMRLQSDGITIDIKTIVAISRKMAKQARLAQGAESYMMTLGKSGTIVISVDGGRIKVRTTKKGPKTKKKRSRFKGDWREVKLFVVYVADEEGNKQKHCLPIVDGMIGSPDAVFALLAQYLSGIDIASFHHIVFIADGAPWIWKRARAMLVSLAINANKMIEILDYYHAIEHLNKLATLLYKQPHERKQWIKRCKKLLLSGHNSDFITELQSQTSRSRSKKIKQEVGYFLNNENRLGYKSAKDHGIPIGSGAMESSIRRVVNLRMKGNSIFWKQENANDRLMLRSYYKAGRWGDLENMAFEGGLKMAA